MTGHIDDHVKDPRILESWNPEIPVGERTLLLCCAYRAPNSPFEDCEKLCNEILDI